MKTLIVLIIILLSVASTPWALKKALDRRHYGDDNKKDIPRISLDKYIPVLKCSICNDEQVLCVKDRETGKISELMLIKSPSELYAFCEANGINAEDIKKIY